MAVSQSLFVFFGVSTLLVNECALGAVSASAQTILFVSFHEETRNEVSQGEDVTITFVLMVQRLKGAKRCFL